ncbi:MAG: hypothetical protein GKR90_14785 [Pseudomonadales bacterium]|nr:hypothetical protein [Pseudomonadales bacterium]
MRRQATQAMALFRQDITDTLTRLATKQVGIALWDEPEWRNCLLENNWVCASWPMAWGGAGWSSEQKFVWYSAVHHIFDDYVEPPEIHDVGPCLQRWGNQLGHELLPAILNLEARWSLALFEGSFNGIDLATELTASGRLSGRKTQVRFAQRAEKFLVAARFADKFVLLDVPVDAPGVEVEAIAGLNGDVSNLAWAEVKFDDVAVTTQQICGELDSSEALRLLCHQTVSLELGRSGAIDRQLLAARQQIETQASLEAEFSNRLAEAEIGLQALVAMEARVVTAAEIATPPPIPRSLLQARGLALQLEVGELLVDAFGYYALPYPDEISLHNEGPIGSSSGMAASRAMLRATEQVNYANLAGDLYDIAAEVLLSEPEK